DLPTNLLAARRSPPDPAVRHHCTELVHTRPGQGPHRRALGELTEQLARLGVKGGLPSVGIYEDVRVDRDHGAPSLSYAASRIAAHDAPANSSVMPSAVTL